MKKSRTKEKIGFSEFLEMFDPAKGILKLIFFKMRHKIEIEKCDLKINFGAYDAAQTGAIYGGIWGLHSTIFAFLSHFFRIKEHALEVTPDFHNKKFDFELESIITIRIIHVLRALLNGGIIYLKYSRAKRRNRKICFNE